MGKVGIDTPVPYFVGIGQGVSRHLAANAHVVKLVLLSAQTSFDVAQAFPVSQLGKCHASKLIEAGKGLDFVIAPIALNTPTKGVQR